MDPLMEGLRALASVDVLYNAAVADRLGINTTDLRLLSYLDLAGSLSPGELAARSGLTSGAITGSVNRLTQARLVRRDSDPSDARKIRVTPLPERRAEIDRLMAPLGHRLAQAASHLSDQERHVVTAFVDSARRILDDEARRLRHGVDPHPGT